MKRWEKRSERYLFRTPWLSLRKDAYKTPGGKIIDDFYIVERPNFVVVVPETKDGKFILVQQYRHGIEKTTLNFPTGFVEKGEPIEKTAIRELLEETGFSGGNIKLIGSFLLSPPFIKCTGHVFFAHNVSKKSRKKNSDIQEVDKIILVNRRGLEELIHEKKLRDFVSISSYFLSKKKSRSV